MEGIFILFFNLFFLGKVELNIFYNERSLNSKKTFHSKVQKCYGSRNNILDFFKKNIETTTVNA